MVFLPADKCLHTIIQHGQIPPAANREKRVGNGELSRIYHATLKLEMEKSYFCYNNLQRINIAHTKEGRYALSPC
ncbi:hypothetical protein CWD78_11455 [Dickeya dadantii]|nr:hypothetical protein [Dickeya dadantii]